MLLRRVLAVAHSSFPRQTIPNRQAYSPAHPATATIKVPQMAEAIAEGTLKSKQVGDAVAADEEVVTIETDKVCPSSSHLLLINFSQIDVSVNAPQAGTILKLLVDEEASVTVGQDLFLMEFGEGAKATASSQSAPFVETPQAGPSDPGQKDTKRAQPVVRGHLQEGERSGEQAKNLFSPGKPKRDQSMSALSLVPLN